MLRTALPAQRAYNAQNNKLHYKQKEPPQSLTGALWRFGFMNVNWAGK